MQKKWIVFYTNTISKFNKWYFFVLKKIGVRIDTPEDSYE